MEASIIIASACAAQLDSGIAVSMRIMLQHIDSFALFLWVLLLLKLLSLEPCSFSMECEFVCIPWQWLPYRRRFGRAHGRFYRRGIGTTVGV